MERNLETSREFLERIPKIGGGNEDYFRENLSPQVQWHDPAAPETLQGIDAVLDYVRGFVHAMPDIRFGVQDAFAAGDKVVTRWIVTGTNTGRLEGRSPTGNPVSVEGITIDRYSEGKLVESWNVWDTLGFRQQLAQGDRQREAAERPAKEGEHRPSA